MPRMVCMKCNLFFHVKKNGVIIEEGMPIGDSPPGKGDWASYKLWRADLWECRGCGDEVVAGFAGSHFAEHYEPRYKGIKEASDIISFVKDCL